MEITGLFVVAVSTPVLGAVAWLILSRFFRDKKVKKSEVETIVEAISKELEAFYKTLSEENYKNLQLIFLDKTKEFLETQENFQDIFLFNELKYANFYLNQLLRSIRVGNKNIYLLYKTRHFLNKGVESIPSFYARKKIESIISNLEEIKGALS